MGNVQGHQNPYPNEIENSQAIRKLAKQLSEKIQQFSQKYSRWKDKDNYQRQNQRQIISLNNLKTNGENLKYLYQKIEKFQSQNPQQKSIDKNQLLKFNSYLEQHNLYLKYVHTQECRKKGLLFADIIRQLKQFSIVLQINKAEYIAVHAQVLKNVYEIFSYNSKQKFQSQVNKMIITKKGKIIIGENQLSINQKGTIFHMSLKQKQPSLKLIKIIWIYAKSR